MRYCLPIVVLTLLCCGLGCTNTYRAGIDERNNPFVAASGPGRITPAGIYKNDATTHGTIKVPLAAVEVTLQAMKEKDHNVTDIDPDNLKTEVVAGEVYAVINFTIENKSMGVKPPQYIQYQNGYLHDRLGVGYCSRCGHHYNARYRHRCRNYRGGNAYDVRHPHPLSTPIYR